MIRVEAEGEDPAELGGRVAKALLGDGAAELIAADA